MRSCGETHKVGAVELSGHFARDCSVVWLKVNSWAADDEEIENEFSPKRGVLTLLLSQHGLYSRASGSKRDGLLVRQY